MAAHCAATSRELTSYQVENADSGSNVSNGIQSPVSRLVVQSVVVLSLTRAGLLGLGGASREGVIFRPIHPAVAAMPGQTREIAWLSLKRT